jgi:hypothetical protein
MSASGQTQSSGATAVAFRFPLPRCYHLASVDYRNAAGRTRPTMTLPTDSQADGLWALTTYFNPMRFRRRLSNFKTFRERLNAPLVAVELAYDSDFQLQEQDAEILIRLRGGAVLWQKERLLNLALQALPRQCRKVAWLDCDVIFGAADWAESASGLLDRFALAQIFKRVHYLSPHWTSAKDYMTEAEFTRPSAAFSISCGAPAATCIGHSLDIREGTSASGFAWAARRELLDKHGFFDSCILGGGDRAMACAANHCFDELMKRHYMNKRQQDRYIAWAKPFYETVRAEVGYLEGDIFHLWHGDVRERRTRSRHEGLQRFQFDPFTDIAIDTNGCWRWNTEKQEMHDYIRGYFSSRREDG